jgi:DNA-directed RNA polymerase specialized sigma24 family protein
MEPTASGFADQNFEAQFLPLFRVAMRPSLRILRDVAGAEDVAAEVLARLYADWRRFDGVAWLEPWVVRCATNLAIDHVRRARRRTPPLVTPGPDGALEVPLDLAEAVARLPRRQREAVALRFFGDLSEADVAALLGISVGSVKTHLLRAMRALRDDLGDSWRESLAFG